MLPFLPACTCHACTNCIVRQSAIKRQFNLCGNRLNDTGVQLKSYRYQSGVDFNFFAELYDCNGGVIG